MYVQQSLYFCMFTLSNGAVTSGYLEHYLSRQRLNAIRSISLILLLKPHLVQLLTLPKFVNCGMIDIRKTTLEPLLINQFRKPATVLAQITLEAMCHFDSCNAWLWRVFGWVRVGCCCVDGGCFG